MIWDKIKQWYKGDDGNPQYDPVAEKYTYGRQPYRHWLAKLISKLLFPLKSTWRLILKNPNAFLTQLFALIAIILSAITLYLQFNVDDENYKRCTITSTDKESIYIKCRK